MFKKLGASFEKLYEKKVINLFLAGRYCQECAKKEWEKEKKDQTLRVLPGICQKCGKMGIVAYIDES